MTEIRPSSDRAFGLVMSGFLAMAGVWPLLDGEPVRWWMACLAGALLAVALAHAPLLAPLNRAWSGLAFVLHRVTTPVALGILFFGVLTPVAALTRMFGRDALRLRLDPTARTYWQDRVAGPEASTMTRQF